MIVRVGDERRHLRDEHIRKLKDFILSEESLTHHRDLAIDTLTSCIQNLPHKVMLYTALTALIAEKNPGFSSDLVKKVVEAAHEALTEGRATQAKSIFRFLGAVTEDRVIEPKALTQTLM